MSETCCLQPIAHQQVCNIHRHCLAEVVELAQRHLAIVADAINLEYMPVRMLNKVTALETWLHRQSIIVCREQKRQTTTHDGHAEHK